MDMEAVSSQLLSRYSPDRSQERSVESSRKQHPLDAHHPDRRVGHAHRHEKAHDIEDRREVDDRHDARRHHPEHAGETSALTYRRSERTALHIQTQEGDSVRLKIRASESLSVDAGQSADDGETVSEVELQARSLTRISIKVKGDLNEQEMAAIQAVIEQAGTMAEDFFAGNAEDAFATASSLEIDAAQLANVRIRMKTSEQLTYPMPGILPARHDGPQTSGLEPASTSPTPAAEAPSDSPATPAAGAEVENAGAESNNAEGAAAPAATAVDAAGDTTDRTSIMANALQSIGVFLNNLIDAFSGDDDAHGNDLSAGSMTLKLQVFRSMLLSVSELENTAADKPATALAADTIDAVTAQQVPPLDAVA